MKNWKSLLAAYGFGLFTAYRNINGWDFWGLFAIFILYGFFRVREARQEEK